MKIPTSPNMIEHLTKDGKLTYSLACGPLSKQRYINPKLEKELILFRIEIEEKFITSKIKNWVFPRSSALQSSEVEGDELNLINAKSNRGSSVERQQIGFNIRSTTNKSKQKLLSPIKAQGKSSQRYKNDQTIQEMAVNRSFMFPIANNSILDVTESSLARQNQLQNQSTILMNPNESFNNEDQYRQIAQQKLAQMIKNGKIPSSIITPKDIVKQQKNRLTAGIIAEDKLSRIPDIFLGNSLQTLQNQLKSVRNHKVTNLAQSQDRYQQVIKTSRNGTQNNYISVQNHHPVISPQVIIQSPQNNTIILINDYATGGLQTSKAAGQSSSRNFLNKIQITAENSAQNRFINTSIQADLDSYPFEQPHTQLKTTTNKSKLKNLRVMNYSNNNRLDTIANSQQQQQTQSIFDTYLKQHNLGIQSKQGGMLAPSILPKKQILVNQGDSRNNISIINQNRSKYQASNRSTVKADHSVDYETHNSTQFRKSNKSAQPSSGSKSNQTASNDERSNSKNRNQYSSGERQTFGQKTPLSSGIKKAESTLPPTNGNKTPSSNTKVFQPILARNSHEKNAQIGFSAMIAQNSGNKNSSKERSQTKTQKTSTFNYEEKNITPNKQQKDQFKQKQVYEIVDKGEKTTQQDNFSDISRIQHEVYEDRIRIADDKFMDMSLKHDDPLISLNGQLLANKDPRDTNGSFKVFEEIKNNDVFGNKQYQTEANQKSDFNKFNIEDELNQIQSLRLQNQILPNLQNIELKSDHQGRLTFENPHQLFDDAPITTLPQAPSAVFNNDQYEAVRILNEQNQLLNSQIEQLQQQEQNGGKFNIHSFGTAPQTSISHNQHIMSFAPADLKNQITINSDDHNQSKVVMDSVDSLQQKRLNEILGSTNELQSPRSHVQQIQGGNQLPLLPGIQATNGLMIDQQSINQMIEIEKNYVILQYESILQQLNIEFTKLIAKQKDADEQIVAKDQMIQSLNRILQDKDASMSQQTEVNRQLQTQVQELLGELEFLTAQRQKHLSENREENQIEAMEHQRMITMLHHKISLYESNEAGIRAEADEALSKARNMEQQLRLRDEELRQSTRERQSKERDYLSMKGIEEALKNQIKSINEQRINLEDVIQELKHQVTQQQIVIRQKDQEIDNMNRETRTLKGSLDVIQQSANELMVELNSAKEQLSKQDQDILKFRSQIEKLDRECKLKADECRRLEYSLNKEREDRSLEVDNYQQELAHLSKALKETQANLTQVKREYQSLKNQLQDYENSLHQEPIVQARQEQRPVNQKVVYPPPKSQDNRFENQQDFYSPQRITQTTQKQQPYLNQQDYNSPRRVEPNHKQSNSDTSGKNAIVWPHMWSATTTNQKTQMGQGQQQSSRQVHQNEFYINQASRTRDDAGSLKRMNQPFQNTQQYDGRQNQERDILRNQRSLEKVPNYQQQEKQQFNFLNTPVQQNSLSQSQGPYQKSQQQDQQWPQPKAQQNNWNQNQQNTSQRANHHQESQQAAGKKTMTQMSPFRDKNNEKEITHLQNSLSAMQIDKERLENDYRKMGIAKNKLQIEKKKEMELEIEIVNKNIQNIRQKLREFNAF